MVASLEVRWFLPGPTPAAVREWFDALGPPVEATARTDRYLIPTESDDLGLKVREGHIEAKQRTARHAVETWGRAEAHPEAWRKWSLGEPTGETLTPGWVDLPKTRRQRWVQMESAACALELGTVEHAGTEWWTVCLEASGGDAETRQRIFRTAAEQWLNRADAPALPADAACGYPAWLRREAADG